MGENGGGKVRESKQPTREPERQPHVDEAAAAPSVGLAARVAGIGGAATAPRDRHDVLRTRPGAGRGMDPPRAGYVLQLQRTHGNRQMGRVLADLAPRAPRSPANSLPAATTTLIGQAAGAAPGPVLRRQPVAHNRAANQPVSPHGARNGWSRRDLQALGSGAQAVGGALAGGIGGLAAAAGQGELALVEQAAHMAGIPVDAIMALVQRAPQVLMRLVTDPGGFIHHLLDAVKEGLHRFAANIRRHIMNGLFEWLTGSIKGGLKLPDRFDLRGIFGFVLEVLGLTVEHVKEQLALRIGRRNVKRLEQAWGKVSRYVSAGVEGLRDLVQGQLGELKDRFLGMIEDWAIAKIVEQGIVFILTSFNPAGALVQVLRAVWHVFTWLREKGGALLAMAEQLTDSIGEIADGAIGHAAGAIEQTLAGSIAPLLLLLARLLGLGGIPDQIKHIVEGVREWVERAIDAAIDKLLSGMKWLASDEGDGKQGAREGEPADDDQDRLDAAVAAAVAIAGRFARRRVRAGKLRPLMQGIKHRYRLREVDLVPSGAHWVVRVVGTTTKSEDTEAMTPEIAM